MGGGSIIGEGLGDEEISRELGIIGLGDGWTVTLEELGDSGFGWWLFGVAAKYGWRVGYMDYGVR